ncbi:MAG: glutathione peroxidase [Myxococcales bacterium]|nr:glutathione peroxidase [Myxococcales bacterium]
MGEADARALYDLSVVTLRGEPRTLAEYADKVVLIVNTASHCVFTPQYEKLEALHRTYRGRGFSVLGFPCNQFGNQEPGPSDEIAHFCETHYGVSFPLFEKVDVNGETAHPLFVTLKERAPGIFGTRAIKWNFTKFLVSRGAREVQRFAPVTTPQEIRDELELML